MKLFYIPLVVLVLPYYLYSTYFFIQCQLARGMGPEAGYRVLNMLPLLQDTYWWSWFGASIALVVVLSYYAGKILHEKS